MWETTRYLVSGAPRPGKLLDQAFIGLTMDLISFDTLLYEVSQGLFFSIILTSSMYVHVCGLEYPTQTETSIYVSNNADNNTSRLLK